jgi:hypothetical protein
MNRHDLLALSACALLAGTAPAAPPPAVQERPQETPLAGDEDAGPVGPQLEEVYPVVVLDNGDFSAPPGPLSVAEQRALDGLRIPRRIPWWSGSVDAQAIKRQAETYWLKLEELDATAEQPVPVYAPYARGVLVSGLVRGHYPDITLVDGRGGEATVELERQLEPKSFIQSPDPLPFELGMAAFDEVLGRPLEPRLTLRLGPVRSVREPGGFEGPDRVYWTRLQVLAPMPLPTPQALRLEIVRTLDRIFTTYFERSLDRSGPRETGFVAQSFDVVTGEPLSSVPGGWIWLWDYVLDALELEPRESWRAALDQFLTDYL